MAKNDKYLLDQVLSAKATEVAPDLPDDRFFELFVADELLKHYGLSNDELDSGLVAGGNDGGIDGIYAFINDNLLSPDYDYPSVKNNPVIHLVIIQAKQSTSFSETAINNLISSANDLLDLEATLPDLSKRYNGQLMAVIADYHNAVRELANKFPIFRFSYYYVTKGDSTNVHQNVAGRVKTLEEKLIDYFNEIDFNFKFLGARDLLALARKQTSSALKLNLTDYLPAGNGGVIGLVKLKEYFDFITDSDGRRLQNIFDANVREYVGDVDVNKGIRATLEKGDPKINFWWLNNGITIVASKAPVTGKTLMLENPKVVNGLQTSQEIFDYFSSRTIQSEDNRELLVRVIVTADEEIRNLVIKATNSQTKISPEILRATEQIHHDIEQDFYHHGLFYDRQKNYYKNLGKPRNKIVTVKYLAQTITAMVLREPNNSRGRPTNLINDEASYQRIFSSSYDISLYRKCALLMKTIDDFLRRDAPDFAKRESTNLRWQLAMFVAALLSNDIKVDPNKLANNLSADGADSELLSHSVRHVYTVFSTIKLRTNLDGDRIAKNKDFDTAVISHLGEIHDGHLKFDTREDAA